MPQPSPNKKQKTHKCPVCRRAASEDAKPFCSKRCTDADLARWLGGGYAIPGRPASDDELGQAVAEDPKAEH